MAFVATKTIVATTITTPLPLNSVGIHIAIPSTIKIIVLGRLFWAIFLRKYFMGRGS
jgi:hypothetical protein